MKLLTTETHYKFKLFYYLRRYWYTRSFQDQDAYFLLIQGPIFLL